MLFQSDTYGKIQRDFHYQPSDDVATIATKQDVTEIVETNKFEYNMHDERSRWKGDMVKAASIPLTLFMELWKKGIIQDRKRFGRWLDDGDNAAFRTRPGKIGAGAGR
jgi:hypothetical protein